MTIEIPFEIGEIVWFISPKGLNAMKARLNKIKTETTERETKIKYNVDIGVVKNEEGTYVWAIFKTKQDLINSL